MPPPPPPPPPAAPPPAPPPPALSGASAGAGGGDGATLDAVLAKRGRAADHVPTRPKTPPPKPPDQLGEVAVCDVDSTAVFNHLQFGANLLLLDVRAAEHFAAGHIRSAVSLPVHALSADELVQQESQLPPPFVQRRTYTVVVYDGGSSSSSDAGELAMFVGRLKQDRRCQKQVLALKGGYAAFQAKYPFMTLASTADGPGGGITATAADIDYHLEYPSEILDGFMYLGSWGSAKSKTVLTHLAITHVVNATAVCEMPFQDELKYIQTALDDKPGADIRQFFEQTIEFVEACEAAGGRVLIHCQMGMSRSSTLVILWLMKKHGMNLRDATAFVRQRRTFINPNPGFLEQLGRYEVELFGSTTIRFPDDGKPITLRTIYSWRQDDGSWVDRVVAGYAT